MGYSPPGTFLEADERCPEAMAKPGPLWGRVAITEPGGRTVEVDTPSGWTLAEWRTYAERYHGPGCAVTPIAGLPKPRGPVNLDEALRAACEDVPGITPAQFRSLEPVDQRFRLRGIGPGVGRCDIGAYERGGGPPGEEQSP